MRMVYPFLLEMHILKVRYLTSRRRALRRPTTHHLGLVRHHAMATACPLLNTGVGTKDKCTQHSQLVNNRCQGQQDQTASTLACCHSNTSVEYRHHTEGSVNELYGFHLLQEQVPVHGEYSFSITPSLNKVVDDTQHIPQGPEAPLSVVTQES